MQLKKASLIALMIFNVAGCSTVELIHVPVGCLGLPAYKPAFTQEEADSMLDSAVDKVVLMRTIYKSRIESQCKINFNHDIAHAE
jgi:hypothetical protein